MRIIAHSLFFRLLPAFAAGLVFFHWHIAVPHAGDSAANRPFAGYVNGMHAVDCRAASPKAVAREIEKEFRISIFGLSSFNAEKLDLSLRAASAEDLLKQFMAAAGAGSYAFKYRNTTLTTLYIVPSDGRENTASTSPLPGAEKKKEVLGARVTSIADGAGIMTAALKPGDIIIEYDNVTISGGPIELGRLMDEQSGRASVEIRLLRDSVPVTAFVPGGHLNAGLKSVPLEFQP